MNNHPIIATGRSGCCLADLTHCRLFWTDLRTFQNIFGLKKSNQLFWSLIPQNISVAQAEI